ncbi:hypothetical protein SASPL_150122 [Salvia splendens]|uniref:Uncharacterized protein n=1 Tax=Salvia splendens TaxID=180675 RepID=A0A8X8W601_SALSN|nr:uncharacterized protein LOC121782984 [Salvia splendens]KAG6388690.1 hypothetical protein SASPL_150122 [Salvia splendens]
MSIASSSSIIIAKPSTSLQSLPWNPISRLAISNCKTDEFGFWAAKKTLQHTRKSFVVSADTAPENPPASAPTPPPSKPMSWVLGFVVTFILPFFTSKLGPLQEIKDRLETSLQAVENIAEAVEVVAESVDKIAENYAEDLPQGKLRDLVEKVEHFAEKTAEAAGALDNIIDKVQDVSEHVDSIAIVTNKVEDLLRHKR